MTSAPAPFELAGRRLTGMTGGTDSAVGVSFDFRLGNDEFTEHFVFDFGVDPTIDADSPIVGHLLDVAQLCVGVSYYKLTMPGVIHSDRPLPPVVGALVPHLYDHGLRELAVRNHLDVPHTVTIDAELSEHATPEPDESTRRRPLLPFGGGKDSTLALTIVSDAAALAIHPTEVQRRVTRAAGVDLLGVTRSLDPLLARRTAEGGRNGHIPITAINSSIAALVAALTGFTDVVLANERSADEPTMYVNGAAVNHQYSKTFAFEQVLADALRPAGITYFSLLRRYSELAIAGALAPNETLRGEILSCNRAFSLSRTPANPTWCLDCAKCRFTFLCFAVFLAPDEATRMFGGNPLDDPAQVEGFRALWDDKPFDCVGELAESALAMAYLAGQPAWRDQRVVLALGAQAGLVSAKSGITIDDLLLPRGNDAVPESYRSRLTAVMSHPESLVGHATR